jgi:hypothetical protein
MDFKNYLLLAGAGILVTLYKITKTIGGGQRLQIIQITTKILLALIISLLITPKVMIWLNWGVEGGLTINALLNLFSEGIIAVAEKSIPKKIEEKIDKF